jgi:pimeloyl-ACP methyl ester carboxylesterase
VLVHGVTSSSRTWWRVGQWFAENGWRTVAVDLRGHGSSPRFEEAHLDLGVEALAADVHETFVGLLGPGERVDVMLGHSLGALVALKLLEIHDDGLPVRRVVLEDPPGPENTDTGEIADGIEADAASVLRDRDAFAREKRAANPHWIEEDVRVSVANMLECDAGPVAAFIRRGLGYDLAGSLGRLEVPALLILGREERDSLLPEPERGAASAALERGAVRELNAGHDAHRDDFEGYVRVLGEWLRGPSGTVPTPPQSG